MKWETKPFSSLYEMDSRNGLTKPSRVRGLGYKMINMGELFSYDRIYDVSMELVPVNDSEKRCKVEVGDLLFARQSLVLEGAGKCSIVMETSPLTVFESHIIRVRLDSSIANPLFYYYYFKSEFSPIKTIVSQCAQAGIRGSDLQLLSVIIPPKPVQDAIADKISKYDDMIENNQKQINLLEEAAQRLYKEWFIDLRFPGHETTPIVNGIPDGWKRDRADSFFDITIGKTPPRAEKEWFVDGNQGVPWISISDMGKSGAYIFETSEGLTNEAISRYNVKIVPKNTVLVSFKLTVGRVSITTCDMCSNEAIAHFRVDQNLRDYTYLYLKAFEYDNLGNTSSISKAINSKIIKGMPFIMPDKSTLNSFNRLVNPILQEIHNKSLQIHNLTEARDRLLPKLMSGEIEV